MSSENKLPTLQQLTTRIWDRMTDALAKSGQVPELGSVEARAIVEAGWVASDLESKQKEEEKKPAGQ